MNVEKPTEEELAAAPTIEEWELVPAGLRTSSNQHRLRGVFHGHPTIADGERGHSSDVLRIDAGEPARWAICRSRTYRLGRRK